MSIPSAGQDLIAAFFEAVDLRQLAQADALIAELEASARRQIELIPWVAYLKGILAFEMRRNWSEAEQIFEALLQTGLEPTLRGRVLFALGRSLDIQGRWDAAITTFERVIEFAPPLDQAKAWKHIAITCCRGFNQGDFGGAALERALVSCRRALDVLEPIPDPSAHIALLTGSVWNTLGAAQMHLGRWDDAIDCYQRDLAICQAFGDEHGVGVSLLNQGEVYQQRGRDTWPRALECYAQALARIRAADDRYLETDVLANLGLLHQAMDQHGQALAYYRQAIQIIEELRAGVSTEEARAGFFATVVDTYTNTVLLCLLVGREDLAFDYVERARSRAFLDLLAERAPDLTRRMDTATMPLAAVQAALPADAVLLEYFTSGLVEARASQGVRRYRVPAEKTLIFAVTRDMLRVYDAGFSPNLLQPTRLSGVVENHFLDPAIRRRLYDHLIAPVAPLLRSRRRLYLAPHGPLHYIPFQALLSPDGEPLLRADGPQMIYGPGATFLFRHGRAPARPAPLPCLALGHNGDGATRLRFGEEEARSIARMTGGHAMIGASLTRAALYQRAGDYRLLHISCHGAFDPESPLRSALHLGPGEDLTALDILAALRLRCDLVTLSACESGLSRIRRGDELMGLVRAFVFAGARALVCTLWRVDEVSTRLLMERFYEEIQRGSGFAEALRRAQIYLQNLTRKEVRAALVRIFVAETLHPVAAEPGAVAPPYAPVPLAHTWAYLKGFAPAELRAGAALAQGPEEERIFSEPLYWAPFILIGDYGSP